MPDSNGQLQLQDYLIELRARGFDGYSQADLTTFVNRGYFHVARKYPLWWLQAEDTLSYAVGEYRKLLWPAQGGELPFFRQIDAFYITGPESYRNKIMPTDDHVFFEQYLPQDLSSAQNRGRPTSYYVFENQLWVLQPPDQQLTVVAKYHRRLALLKDPTDVPLTPVHMDEGITLAALIRCHKRANESGLADVAQADLNEFFDDALDDEEMQMAESVDRVSPDDTWI